MYGEKKNNHCSVDFSTSPTCYSPMQVDLTKSFVVAFFKLIQYSIVRQYDHALLIDHG